ncbi:Solute carrier family 52, riboflavin transporter, member 3-B [Bagarius yarrelli]|uniref:Solute carrier family 52, riboflavin transporter, member 3-B n=1 Tax=Bagarius yarrelli TaxID=175774 RepID=A0A556V8P3_BAGYA|nr:Solute carrier family 52, riboflavin transporter, member 3-B [Bagarius yarrelli]
MSLLTHILACLFGIGSWVAINGMWVELPLIVPEIPEGWYLPSYLTVIIQLANIGPLFITLMHRFRPGALDERPVIYIIVVLGVLATILLAFFWKHTLFVGNEVHSVALLSLSFLLSVVDCTSSVTFLPFMMRLQPQYLTTYFVGEGLSGLIPALLALIQGVGVVQCKNTTAITNISMVNYTGETNDELEAYYQPANFSVQVFFLFLSTMMAVCLGAFVMLNYHPAVVQEQRCENYLDEAKHQEKVDINLSLQNPPAEQTPMLENPESQEHKTRSNFGKGSYSRAEVVFIFIVLAWVNALTNAVLPSVQSYSCLPYGNQAYHLATTMAAVANPVACFIAMFFPIRSLMLMGVLTVTGTGFGAYIMGMAALSPCPLLVDHELGAALMVITWVIFVLTLSYVKVIIGVILRDEGHSALVWCGAVVQLGSMIYEVTLPPEVSLVDGSCQKSPELNVDGLHVRVRLKSCGAVLLKDRLFRRVLPLPNGNWNTLVDDWCCHPDPFANKKLLPREEDCLLGDTYFLLTRDSSCDRNLTKRVDSPVMNAGCNLQPGKLWLLNMDTLIASFPEKAISSDDLVFASDPHSNKYQSHKAVKAIKVLYLPCTHNQQDEAVDAWEKDISVHPLILPLSTCEEVLQILSSSTKTLPPSLRSMNCYKV